MRRLTVEYRQMPLSAHKPCFRAQQLNAQIGKFKLPHLMSATCVGRSITVHRGLPSIVLLRAGEKCEIGRVPVAGHERFEVVTVPGFLLGDDDMLDSRPGVIWGGGASLGMSRVQKYQRQSTKEKNADGQLDAHGSLQIPERTLVSHGGIMTAQRC
jgi:hypothetical protein